MKEFPRKFLSLRDKNGIHRRSNSVPPEQKDKVSLPHVVSWGGMNRWTGVLNCPQSESITLR